MTQSKYDSNKNGMKVQPHHYKIFDPATKLYFPTKNGCDKHENCLTCPFPDCIKPIND